MPMMGSTPLCILWNLFDLRLGYGNLGLNMLLCDRLRILRSLQKICLVNCIFRIRMHLFLLWLRQHPKWSLFLSIAPLSAKPLHYQTVTNKSSNNIHDPSSLRCQQKHRAECNNAYNSPSAECSFSSKLAIEPIQPRTRNNGEQIDNQRNKSNSKWNRRICLIFKS